MELHCATFLSTLKLNGANKPFPNGPLTRVDTLRCNATAAVTGPFVYDTVPTLHKSEGIGSRLQQHKVSLILANAVRGRWLGTLWNGHDNLDYAPFFGLDAPGCQSTLHEPSDKLRFWDRPLLSVGIEALPLATCAASEVADDHAAAAAALRDPASKGSLPESTIRQLCAEVEQCTCSASSHPLLAQALDTSSATTVLAVKEHLSRRRYNYCAWGSHTRQLFHAARVARGRVASKPPRARWIGVHLRWGDVGAGKVGKGVSLEAKLSQLATIVTSVRRSGPFAADEDRPVEVTLFSEGNASAFAPFVTQVVDAGMGGVSLSLGDSEMVSVGMMKLEPRFAKAASSRQSGLATQDDFDRMAQSDVLIGESTSFFAAAAHLCEACVVVTDVEHEMFQFEGPRRPPHHQVVPLQNFNAETFDAAWTSLEEERHLASCE